MGMQVAQPLNMAPPKKKTPKMGTTQGPNMNPPAQTMSGGQPATATSGGGQSLPPAFGTATVPMTANTGAATAAPAPTAAQPPPMTFNDWMNTQYGQGQPFGMQSWYGANPLKTAQDVANQNLGQNLAGIRNNYAGRGFGNSAREGLAEGTAVAQSNVGLGDVLAGRGIQSYESDANRGLQATLGGQQQNLAANAQLGNIGNMLTSIGVNEQSLPMVAQLLQLFSIFNATQGGGSSSTSGSTGSGFLGM